MLQFVVVARSTVRIWLYESSVRKHHRGFGRENSPCLHGERHWFGGGEVLSVAVVGAVVITMPVVLAAVNARVGLVQGAALQ